MANIDPATLARLAQLYQSGQWNGVAQDPLSQGGTFYNPLFDVQYNGEGSPLTRTMTGYGVGSAYNPGTGTQYEKYDLSGNDTGQSYFEKKDTGNYDNAAIMAALGITGANLFAAGGGFGGVGSSGGDGIPEAIGNGSGSDAFTFSPAADSQAANAAINAGGGNALTGYAGAVSPAIAGGAGGGGLLSGALSGVGSYLGPVATIAGALAGSQGARTQQTTTQSMTPELKPYVFGQNGLLNGAQGLFQQQTAPGAMPGYGQMQNVAMGLLSQPVAGNGFQQFMARPRFGG
jgi:hypothetical protein